MAGIKINLKGFDSLLEQIENASGNVEAAAMQAINEGAAIAETELKAACSSAGVPASLTSKIQTRTEQNGNRFSARVGWKMGDYNPRNPSAGFKIVFLNYGTPNGRKVKEETRVTSADSKSGWTTTTNRGVIVGRGFIQKANKAASPKIKKAQEQKLADILKGLS